MQIAGDMHFKTAAGRKPGTRTPAGNPANSPDTMRPPGMFRRYDQAPRRT